MTFSKYIRMKTTLNAN